MSKQTPLSQTFPSPIDNQRGQGLVEYLIIVALIAVGTIGVVRVLGQSINSRFATISYALQGEKRTPSVDEIPEAHLKKRDLGNFMNGVGSRERNGN
jgi:Flp pilus assembly pilin Flp